MYYIQVKHIFRGFEDWYNSTIYLHLRSLVKVKRYTAYFHFLNNLVLFQRLKQLQRRMTASLSRRQPS